MQLLILIFLHHFGDVWGQPSWLIKAKSKHLWAIYEHCMVWTGLICMGLIYFDNFEPWKFVFLLFVHFIIDMFFYQILPQLRNKKKQYWYIYPDQALHYTQILVVFLL